MARGYSRLPNKFLLGGPRILRVPPTVAHCYCDAGYQGELRSSWALMPEDRKTQSLVLGLPVCREHLTGRPGPDPKGRVD